MDKKQKHDLYVLGGLGVGGLVIFFLLSRNQSAAKGAGTSNRRGSSQSSQPQRTVTANPQQASLDQSIIAAKEQALQAFDQSRVGAEGVQAGQNTAYNQDLTNKLIAFNTNAAQTAQQRIASAAEEAIASTQASEAEQVAQEQEQPLLQEVQNQGNSWWENILGGLGGFFGGGIF